MKLKTYKIRNRQNNSLLSNYKKKEITNHAKKKEMWNKEHEKKKNQDQELQVEMHIKRK